MKTIKILFSLILLSSFAVPLSAVQAQTQPECVYFPNTQACGGYQDADSAIEKCDWEKTTYKCCKFNGSQVSYMFSKECNVGGYTIEEPYKPKCLVGQKCCCHTSAISPTVTPPPAAPKFDIPQFQVPIDTVNLTEVKCTTSTDGTYLCQVDR
jgi:hypothetical protein